MLMKFKSLDIFSIALDESWDIKDTAQVAIFVCGVMHDIKIVDDFLSLISMKATTTGKDVLNALSSYVRDYGPPRAPLAHSTFIRSI